MLKKITSLFLTGALMLGAAATAEGVSRHIQRRGHGLRWNDCRRCDARKRRDHGD